VCENRIKRRNRVSAFASVVGIGTGVMVGEITECSAIGTQQLLELLTRRVEQRRTVRKEHSFEFKVQKLPQRAAHLFSVGAVLRRKKSEAVRCEINQRISHNHRAVVVLLMEDNFSRRGSFNRDCAQVSAQSSSAFQFPNLPDFRR